MGKGRISKWLLQEKKAHQFFRKTNTCYPLIHTRTCVYQGEKNFGFSRNFVCFGFL